MASLTYLRGLCCTVTAVLFVSRINAQCGFEDLEAAAEQFINECETVGASAGRIAFLSGCAKLKATCPFEEPSRSAFSSESGSATAAKSQPPPFDPQVLFQQVISATCVDVFQTTCKNSATEAAVARDQKCFKILSLGPTRSVPGCEDVLVAREVFKNALNGVCEQVPDPLGNCKCAGDGVSNCVETGVKGCGKHFLNFGDTDRFCYVVNSAVCAEKTMESGTFPGAAWKIC